MEMMGFGFFSFFNLIFPIFFILVFGIIVFTLIRNIGEWKKNNNEPVLSVIARVVTKRTNVSRHHDANTNHSSSSTTYYITFEVESGDRMEFRVAHSEYGMLAEGDVGKLTFQGTRYHGFQRKNSN